MSAWVFQDDKQVKKHGTARASWYCGWIDPDGDKRCKSCGPGSEGKRLAERLKKKREAELSEGTYQNDSKKLWKEFRQEYEDRIASSMPPGTRHVTLECLN